MNLPRNLTFGLVSALLLLYPIIAILGQNQPKAHTPYVLQTKATDYYDDGRVVEAYKETRYVYSNGNWRSIRRFQNGFVEERIGVVGRGVFSVDKMAKKLWLRTPYPTNAVAPDLSERASRSRGRKIKVLGYSAIVMRIRQGDRTTLMARAPTLNGEIIGSVERGSGFSRVVEALSITPGQPREQPSFYEDYRVDNPTSKRN